MSKDEVRPIRAKKYERIRIMESLYDAALRAIKEIFNEKSIGAEETKRNLNSLIEEIEILKDTL